MCTFVFVISCRSVPALLLLSCPFSSHLEKPWYGKRGRKFSKNAKKFEKVCHTVRDGRIQ